MNDIKYAQNKQLIEQRYDECSKKLFAFKTRLAKKEMAHWRKMDRVKLRYLFMTLEQIVDYEGSVQDRFNEQQEIDHMYEDELQAEFDALEKQLDKINMKETNNGKARGDETMNEAQFDKLLDSAFEEKAPDYNSKLNIALAGKVSSGKSSLLNALMQCDRSEPLAEVGASSGVTTSITPFRLADDVMIIDCPGLADVRKENSQETQDFLKHIDVGIFVVEGSVDSDQKKAFDDLKNHAEKVFVVLNKIDVWDDMEPDVLIELMQQWQEALGVDEIYPVCCKGYDPRLRSDAPLSVRGVSDLREDLLAFLESQKKDLLLAKHLRNKDQAARRIINTALASVSVEALLPGAGAYITATQITAIASLHYLYTGKVMSKASALQLLPVFAGRNLGKTAFLWVKSFMPPSGVVDVAAAGIAASLTYGMLHSVKWTLANGYTLEEADVLRDMYEKFKTEHTYTSKQGENA